jgi:hypothetical protein
LKRPLFLPVVVLLFCHAVSSFASGWLSITPKARIGAAAFNQVGAVVASNGVDYLAGWTSSQNLNLLTQSQTIGVFVARVNADGSLAAPIARPLDPTATSARGLNLSPSRDGYFASWVSEKGVNGEVMDSLGRVERQSTTLEDTAAFSQTLVAWNGTVHLVLSGFNGPFTAALFDNNGLVLASGIPVGDAHGDETIKAALTSDGAGFLVLATKRVSDLRDDIYGRRISSNGVEGDWFLVRSVTNHVQGLSVTWDGTQDIIAWGDAFGVWTATLSIDSNVIGPSRQLIPDGAAVGQVLWQGGRTWITYITGSAANVITIDADGKVTPPVLLGDSGPGRIAWNGTRMLSVHAAVQPPEATDSDIIGRFLTPTAVDVPFTVSMSETDQEHGDLATDSAGDVVAVWDEKTSAQHQIFASLFVATKRTPADDMGIQLSASGDNTNPAVAFNGSSFLVVWTRTIDNKAETVCRRFSLQGKVLDDQDIVIPGGGNWSYGPRVASDGTYWLVVRPGPFGTECPGFAGSGSALFATRVGTDGNVIDGAGIMIPQPDGIEQDELDLAWNGSLYVAAWTNRCVGTHRSAVSSISGAWIAPDLTHIDVRNLAPLGSVGQGIAYSNPRLSSSGSRTLVAWQAVSGTQYRVIEGIVPQGRQRAVGGGASVFTIPGALLLDVSRDAAGHFLLLTQRPVPFALPYLGLQETIIDDGGKEQSTQFAFAFEPGAQLIGKVIPRAGSLWMIESQFPSVFDPPAAARRLYIHEF